MELRGWTAVFTMHSSMTLFFRYEQQVGQALDLLDMQQNQMVTDFAHQMTMLAQDYDTLALAWPYKCCSLILVLISNYLKQVQSRMLDLKDQWQSWMTDLKSQSLSAAHSAMMANHVNQAVEHIQAGLDQLPHIRMNYHSCLYDLTEKRDKFERQWASFCHHHSLRWLHLVQHCLDQGGTVIETGLRDLSDLMHRFCLDMSAENLSLSGLTLT